MKQVCRDPETKQGRAAVGCTDDQFLVAVQGFYLYADVKTWGY